MKLIDAYNLLVEDGIADNHRYFADVYKLYNFADGDNLRAYLDFIAHEPVMWLAGFPAKLTTRLAFSKPKTAVIKLLKKQSVINAMGADYVARIQNLIWTTFKKEADRIVDERAAKAQGIRVEKVSVGKAVSVVSLESGYTYRGDSEDEEDLVADAVDAVAAPDATEISMEVESLETASVGSMETMEEPIPPLRSYKTITVYPTSPQSPTHVSPSSVLPSSHYSSGGRKPSGARPLSPKTEEERVELLKSVLFKMSQTLPDGVGDAFRLLVSHV